MADGGWIKMWRSVLDWEHYDNINMRLLWFHILLKAEYDGENIGTLQTSLSELSTACQMTKPQVRRCLTVLAESGQISHRRCGNTLMVKINNWQQYQGKKHTYEHTCEHTYEHTSNKAQTVGIKPKTEGAKEEKSTPVSTPMSTPVSTLTLHYYIKKIKKTKIQFTIWQEIQRKFWKGMLFFIPMGG